MSKSETAKNPSISAFRMLVNEMKAKQFDTIRFAAYRTAIKLRYIQHRTFLHLLDISSLSEAFQAVGLHINNSTTGNSQAGDAITVDRPRLEELLRFLYSHLNNNCLPSGQRISVELINNIFLAWLFYSYDKSGSGTLSFFTIRLVLSTMVASKPLDKFKYHFSFLSDSAGALIVSRFEQYLNDLLLMAVGVFEGSNFSYDKQSSRFMLVSPSKPVLLDEFVEKMLTEPGPQCLLWLTIYHRLAFVENVRHPLRCEGCCKHSIIGFRYKCQKCVNYNLCQDCFWTGVVSGSHTNQHDVKEYTTYKSMAAGNPRSNAANQSATSGGGATPQLGQLPGGGGGGGRRELAGTLSVPPGAGQSSSVAVYSTLNNGAASVTAAGHPSLQFHQPHNLSSAYTAILPVGGF